MKRMNLKGLLTVVLVAVLLTFAVSGTVAYLIDETEPVENIFTPAKVDTEIVEVIENDAKTSIAVQNSSDPEAVDAYVRVAVVGNWCDDNGNIVKPWTPDFTTGENWVKKGDFYYYTKILEKGKPTENLLGANQTIARAGEDGLHLEVTVMQQAIQAEGGAVTVGADGGWTIK